VPAENDCRLKSISDFILGTTAASRLEGQERYFMHVFSTDKDSGLEILVSSVVDAGAKAAGA
jgi:hypothetical protein